MAKAADVSDFDEMLTCPLCLEFAQNPKYLPCIHTFCFECLEKDLENKNKDEITAACPKCGRIYNVPSVGLDGLPTNIFVAQSIEQLTISKTLSTNTSQICELCQNEDSCIYCWDCHQCMCDRCCLAHRGSTVSKSHVIRNLEEMRHSKTVPPARELNCAKHLEKRLELYCSKCRIVICAKCFEVDHEEHVCSGLDETSTKFKNQLKDQLDKLASSINSILCDKKLLNFHRQQLLALASSAKDNITAKCEKRRKLLIIKRDAQLAKLDEIVKERFQEFDNAMEELEVGLQIIKQFKLHSQQLVEIGTPFAIAMLGDDFMRRANELVQLRGTILDGQLAADPDNCLNSANGPAIFELIDQPPDLIDEEGKKKVTLFKFVYFFLKFLKSFLYFYSSC